MNDSFFDYLVSTDQIDEFLGYEPNCPHCGQKLLEIVYGMPAGDIIDQAKNNEIFLGGCTYDEDAPKYHCNNCRRSYSKDLKKYIEEENNFELEEDE